MRRPVGGFLRKNGSNNTQTNVPFNSGVVPLRHLGHVPPDGVATFEHKKWEIVLVTLCIQIEWLFYRSNAFWCDADSIQGTGARAHTFTNRTTWGKQETHQSVLSATKALAKMTTCNRRAINLNNFLYKKNKSGTFVAVG